MIKCECGNHADFYYNKKNLCACHYWIERGKPSYGKNSLIDGVIKTLRYLHPIRMRNLCLLDPDFSLYVSSVPKRKRGFL
jgi:hypothetical protein